MYTYKWRCEECGCNYTWDSFSFDSDELLRDINRHKEMYHSDISEDGWDTIYIDREGTASLRKKKPPEKLLYKQRHEARHHCHHCEKETFWHVEHGFVRYHGIAHLLVCNECGCEVPDFAFDRYLETGRVIIPV